MRITRNRKGTIEIGFIFTFTISAVLLTLFTSIISNVITDFTNVAIHKDLRENGKSIEASIETVQSMAMKNPYVVVEYKLGIESRVRGHSYMITISGQKLRLNADNEISVEMSLMSSPLNLKIKHGGTGIPSSYGELVVVYDPSAKRLDDIKGNEIVLYW